MPITASAKKALRVGKRRKVFNDYRRAVFLRAVKAVKKHVAAKNKADALKALPLAYKVIDKAAKRGVIAKNTAARKKSRLTQLINKLS